MEPPPLWWPGAPVVREAPEGDSAWDEGVAQHDRAPFDGRRSVGDLKASHAGVAGWVDGVGGVRRHERGRRGRAAVGVWVVGRGMEEHP